MPRYVTRIEDRYGNVLHQFTPRRHEAMNAEHAYLMTHLLQSGLGERGSAQALGGYAMTRNNEVGAKTGTTQNYSDGWCVVLTQELATAAWFGGDDMRVHYRDANGTAPARPCPLSASSWTAPLPTRRPASRKALSAGPVPFRWTWTATASPCWPPATTPPYTCPPLKATRWRMRASWRILGEPRRHGRTVNTQSPQSEAHCALRLCVSLGGCVSR
jgi:membrane peptidoglycan carboxypeptidase